MCNMRGKQSKARNVQSVVCTVCGEESATTHHADVQSVYSAKSYDVMRCANCQHFFTWPAPTSPELDDIYNNRYSYDAHSLIEREKVMRAKNYARFIAGMPGVSSAMEVGCMHGLLLTELEKQKIKAAGVELDPKAVEHCQKKGLDVVQSSIEDHLKQAGNKHDVIIMSHVIEHIAKPQEQLTSLHSRMSKNGRLVLITPNSMSKSRRAFGRFWGYWQVPVHINHFNESSMRHLLEKSGFKLVETRYYGGDSLFFLSSLANILGVTSDTQQLSGAKKALVRMASVVLKPWYHSGKEDMLVVAQKV